MKDKIYRNLYLSVDYTKIKSDKGIILGTQFWLIGTLPVLIIRKDKSGEIVKLKVREEIESSDPELRNMLGRKASDESRPRYKKTISEMVLRFEHELEKIKERKVFIQEHIEDIVIINLDNKYAIQ